MISGIKTFLLNFLFPIECLGCEAPDTYLCSECLDKTPKISLPFCFLCNTQGGAEGICERCRKDSPLDGIFAATLYSDTIIGQAIHALKFQYVESMAPVLSQVLIAELKKTSLLKKLQHTIILPLPLHRKRYRERGFNQSYLIAKSIAEALHGTVNCSALVRVAATLQQARLDRQERSVNIKGAFVVKDATVIAGKSVVIVDDVITTGVTMTEAALMLKQAGATAVYGIALAHG